MVTTLPQQLMGGGPNSSVYRCGGSAQVNNVNKHQTDVLKLSKRTRYCNTVVIIVILIYYCPRELLYVFVHYYCTLLYVFNYYLITSENIKLRIVF